MPHGYEGQLWFENDRKHIDLPIPWMDFTPQWRFNARTVLGNLILPQIAGPTLDEYFITIAFTSTMAMFDQKMVKWRHLHSPLLFPGQYPSCLLHPDSIWARLGCSLSYEWIYIHNIYIYIESISLYIYHCYRLLLPWLFTMKLTKGALPSVVPFGCLT